MKDFVKFLDSLNAMITQVEIRGPDCVDLVQLKEAKEIINRAEALVSQIQDNEHRAYAHATLQRLRASMVKYSILERIRITT